MPQPKSAQMTMQTAKPRELSRALKVSEAASALGVSVRTVNGMISNRSIPSVLVGRRSRRILESDVIEYLDRNRK